MIPQWEATLNEMVLLLEELGNEPTGKYRTRLLVILRLAYRLFKEIKKEQLNEK